MPVNKVMGLLVAALLCSLVPAARAEDSFYDGSSGESALQSFASVEQGPKLDLYGFIDFTYSQNVMPRGSPFDKIPHYGSFAVGNVNLYASGELSARFRSLLEVRLLYLPHGSNSQTEPGQPVIRYDTTTTDYTDYERPLRWGGIEIERAFLEFQATSWLALQLGQYLTPYGVWNIDHGTPTVIGVRRPFIIGEALFPERQTGIEAHGAFHLDRTSLGYHLTLSNGRGPVDSQLDLDSNKALGGRLYLRNTTFGSLTLGASSYYGKFTDRTTEYGRVAGSDPPLLEIRDPVTEQFTELALAVDLRWEWSGLLLQSELIRNDRVYEDQYREVIQSGRTLRADYSRLGFYGLVGYRTPYFGIMPYVIFEDYNFAGDTIFAKTMAHSSGFNIRPQPNVVFKAQYTFALLGGDDDARIFRGALRRFDLQAAWAF